MLFFYKYHTGHFVVLDQILIFLNMNLLIIFCFFYINIIGIKFRCFFYICMFALRLNIILTIRAHIYKLYCMALFTIVINILILYIPGEGVFSTQKFIEGDLLLHYMGELIKT